MKHHLTLIAIAAVLVGCGTPPQPPAPPTRLPTYNLGAANTTGDDIAPFLDSTSRLLYFTTDGMRDSAKGATFQTRILPLPFLAETTSTTRPVCVRRLLPCFYRFSGTTRAISHL